MLLSVNTPFSRPLVLWTGELQSGSEKTQTQSLLCTVLQEELSVMQLFSGSDWTTGFIYLPDDSQRVFKMKEEKPCV